MKILSIDSYLDGGSIALETDKGIFCFDDRIRSKTKGRLYNGYPEDDNSNIIENYEESEKEIVEALKIYNDDLYKNSIEILMNSKHEKK